MTGAGRRGRGGGERAAGSVGGEEVGVGGFAGFVRALVRVVYDTPAPLFRFLRRFYVCPMQGGLTPKSDSPAWAGERPFPCGPVYVVGQEEAPTSVRRKRRLEGGAGAADLLEPLRWVSYLAAYRFSEVG